MSFCPMPGRSSAVIRPARSGRFAIDWVRHPSPTSGNETGQAVPQCATTRRLLNRPSDARKKAGVLSPRQASTRSERAVIAIPPSAVRVGPGPGGGDRSEDQQRADRFWPVPRNSRTISTIGTTSRRKRVLCGSIASLLDRGFMGSLIAVGTRPRRFGRDGDRQNTLSLPP